MIAPVRAVLTLGTSGIFLAQVGQVLPPTAVSTIDSAGRLTLDAALVIAVGVLWRAMSAILVTKDAKIAEKDAQIVAMATKVTETMVLVMEAVRELRATVAEQKIAFETLPCAMREEQQHARR